jgi:subtilisin family serine protease
MGRLGTRGFSTAWSIVVTAAVYACADKPAPTLALAGVRAELATSATAAIATRADLVQSMYGLTGTRVRIALLDTGIDSSHPDLADAVVAQQCFTNAACAPFGTDRGTDANDDQGQGTAVAGLVASRGMVGPAGIAPAAELVSIKVLDANDRTRISDLVAAMRWIYEMLPSVHVDVVMLNVGSDALYDPDTCDLGRQHWPRPSRSSWLQA